MQHFEDLPANHRIQIEEASAQFDSVGFASPPTGYTHAGPLAASEMLPQTVSTWLIEPLKAPGFSFPVLFASAETAGIYNIIYRHLFDRRRDLPLPLSFLLDREGMIVKVYQ